MTQQNQFSFPCQQLGHEKENIVGYCLHETCKDNFPFCLLCITNDDDNLHQGHRNICKGFNQIIIFLEQQTQSLICSNEDFKTLRFLVITIQGLIEKKFPQKSKEAEDKLSRIILKLNSINHKQLLKKDIVSNLLECMKRKDYEIIHNSKVQIKKLYCLRSQYQLFRKILIALENFYKVLQMKFGNQKQQFLMDEQAEILIQRGKLLMEKSEFMQAITMLRLIQNYQITLSTDDWNRPETVVTKFCNHPQLQGTSDLLTAMKQIREQGQYKCSCGQQAKSINELAKDVKRHIITNFHKSTLAVDIKLGIILHKYKRSYRYQNALNSFIDQNSKSFLDMQDRFNQDYSITNILIKQQYLEKQITLWAYCLLDKVKINIPVRIINCNHVDCYEFTSLLMKFDQMQKEKKVKFQCEFNGCNNHLNMERLDVMASQLFIDLDYLKLLNAAPTTQYKFEFDFQNKEFVKSPDFDPVIIECLQRLNIPQNQLELMYCSVQNHISTIMNSDALENSKIKQLLNQQKYQDRNVNLIDQFTKKPIEFPVRCINCPSSKCIDIRTLITDYEIKKKPQDYQCPLCGVSLQQRSKNFRGLVYLDQNLVFKLFKDQQNNFRENFYYNGKQYMKEEFIYKQKLSKEDYLSELDRDHPEKERVAEFNNLYCITNSKRKLVTPLIIINCLMSNILDFETFYEELINQNFNIEENGIFLCKCVYCNINPLKNFTTELVYHEALGYAIEHSAMNTIQKGSTLKFDFKAEKQVIIFVGKQNQNQSINEFKSEK